MEMNGVHDMGGMHGFGPVLTEENRHVGRAEWEHRTQAILGALLAAGLANIDEVRHGIERLPPADYLASRYYERWLNAFERLLVEKGVVTAAEVAARTARLRERPAEEPFSSPQPAVVSAQRGQPGLPTTPPARSAPGFRVGDAVVARNVHPAGHTRLPRYVRGRRGVIHQCQGVYVTPDTHAHGQGEQAQPMYTVRFEAAELWSAAAEPRGAVYLDLWESYLEPAPAG
jgi:nitrile hydratase